jgi:hypothetical protein
MQFICDPIGLTRIMFVGGTLRLKLLQHNARLCGLSKYKSAVPRDQAQSQPLLFRRFNAKDR